MHVLCFLLLDIKLTEKMPNCQAINYKKVKGKVKENIFPDPVKPCANNCLQIA